MKIGIVGCGVGAEHHMLGIKDFKGAEIAGVCDLNEERAREFANRHGIKNIYTKLDDMLQQQKPDVVHIVTPPRTHISVAMEAINMGCNVIVEKPFTISTEEADELIRAAEEKKVKLCMMHNHIFDPPIVKAKEIIARGTIGKILYIEAKYCVDKVKMEEEGCSDPNHWSNKLPLGIFGEHGLPHMGYLLLSFLEEVKDVQVCKKEIRSHTDTISEISVLIEGGNAIGNMLMFNNMEYPHFTIHIYGSKAALHINMFDLTLSVEKRRNLPKTVASMLVALEQSVQNIVGTGINIFKIAVGSLKRRPGHRKFIRKFYESILNNTEPPASGEDGREAVRLLELIHEQLYLQQLEIKESNQQSEHQLV